MDKLNEAATVLMEYEDFTSFSKRNTQAVLPDYVSILQSHWKEANNQLIYTVQANRFLRGMVKGLVGTMLHIGRGKKTIADFRKIIEAKDCSLADFSVASHGLFLMKVEAPTKSPPTGETLEPGRSERRDLPELRISSNC